MPSDETDDEHLTPAELKALKMRRTKAKRELKALDARLLDAATAARGQADAETLTCSLLRARLQDGLSRRVAAHRQALVDRYQTWHGKYAVTMRDIEAERDGAARKLNNILAELGYE